MEVVVLVRFVVVVVVVRLHRRLSLMVECFRHAHHLALLNRHLRPGRAFAMAYFLVIHGIVLVYLWRLSQEIFLPMLFLVKFVPLIRLLS